MKQSIRIFSVFIFMFATFLFVGCFEIDSEYFISTDQQITLQGNNALLPEIKLNNNICDWNEFYFDNEDGFVYVYDGKIYLTETAPSEFETELKIAFKKDVSVSTKLLVKKPYIPITSISIEITNKRVYPGENVYYQIKYEPQNAILKNLTVEFDKPEYIDSQGDGYFKLRETTPLNENLKMTIITDNNISCEYEITVDNTVYEVYNVTQLRRMANDPYGYFKLMSDIDLLDANWQPVQNFYGILNGNGHIISGWRYVQNSVGLIGFINSNYGNIKNINITDFIISNNDPSVYGTLSVGLLCADNNGTIENIIITNSKISVDVASMSYDFNSYIQGGLVCGNNNGTLQQIGLKNNGISVYVGTKFQGAEAFCGIVAGASRNGYLLDIFVYDNEMSVCVKVDAEETLLNQHGRPRGSIGGLIGYSYKNEITRAVSFNNSLSLTVSRPCAHTTNIENYNGILIGKSEKSTLGSCVTNKDDGLFGKTDSYGGVMVLNSNSINLSLLPLEFKQNVWWINNYE